MKLDDSMRQWLQSVGLRPESALRLSGRDFGRLCRMCFDTTRSQAEREAILATLAWASAAVDDPTGRWSHDAHRAMNSPSDPDGWEDGDLDPDPGPAA